MGHNQCPKVLGLSCSFIFLPSLLLSLLLLLLLTLPLLLISFLLFELLLEFLSRAVYCSYEEN